MWIRFKFKSFNLIIIISQELITASKRGSHVQRDYARTIIQHTHLMNPLYYRHLHLDISSCAIFTVYPNRIMLWYHTRLMVISLQSEGEQSERTLEPSKNVLVKLNLLHMQRGSPLRPIFRTLSCGLHRHHSILPKAPFIIIFFIIIIIKKISNTRPGEAVWNPISLNTPAPQYKPI